MADHTGHVPTPLLGLGHHPDLCDDWAEKAGAHHGVDMVALRTTDPGRFRELRSAEKRAAFDESSGLSPSPSPASS